jgi:hypothetical protein
MRLLHKEDGIFADVTMPSYVSPCPTLAGTCPGPPTPQCIDTVANRICGLPGSLSPFVAAPRLAPVPALSSRGLLALRAATALAGRPSSCLVSASSQGQAFLGLGENLPLRDAFLPLLPRRFRRGAHV